MAVTDRVSVEEVAPEALRLGRPLRLQQAALRTHALLATLAWVLALTFFAVLMGMVGVKSIYLGNDSINNYARVWYLHRLIFQEHTFDWHFRLLLNGQALTLPYGVVPWLATVPFFHLIGDRAVTFSFLAGVLFYFFAATRARPALADPRLLAIMALSSLLIESMLAFQYSFIWSSGFFFLFVDAIDHRRHAWALLWGAVAVTTHPFAGAIAIGAYAAHVMANDRSRIPDLLGFGALLALVCLPFVLYIRTQPYVGDTTEHLVHTLIYMIRFRSPVLVVPFLLAWNAPWAKRWSLALTLVMLGAFLARNANGNVNYFGVNHDPWNVYEDYMDSPAFEPGATYRILGANDKEDGMYYLIQRGGVLASDLFDQGMYRRWWRNEDQYRCLLRAEHVDYVMFENYYLAKYKSNERDILRKGVETGAIRLAFDDPLGRYAVFDVREYRGPLRDGEDLRSCGL